jgi:hypothetical protein
VGGGGVELFLEFGSLVFLGCFFGFWIQKATAAWFGGGGWERFFLYPNCIE